MKMLRCVVLIHLMVAAIVYCDIKISVTPPYANSKENVNIIILCTVDSRLLNLDELYSIMIKKDGLTVVVASGQGHHNMRPRWSKFPVATNLSASIGYVQVTLPEVTCFNGGNYVCKAAARSANRNVKLETAPARLDVIDADCKVDHMIFPYKPSYTDGDHITIICYTFCKSTRFDWHWSNNSEIEKYVPTRKSCTVKNANNLFNCSVTFAHHVTSRDLHSNVTCGIGKDSIAIKLKVVEAPVINKVDNLLDDEEDTPETLSPDVDVSVIHSTSSSFMIIVFIAVSIVIVVIIVSLVVILLKGRWSEKRKNNDTNSFHLLENDAENNGSINL